MDHYDRGRTSPSPSSSIYHLTQLDAADSQVALSQLCQCGHVNTRLLFESASHRLRSPTAMEMIIEPPWAQAWRKA